MREMPHRIKAHIEKRLREDTLNTSHRHFLMLVRDTIIVMKQRRFSRAEMLEHMQAHARANPEFERLLDMNISPEYLELVSHHPHKKKKTRDNAAIKKRRALAKKHSYNSGDLGVMN